jgi:hypothetical protein
LSLPFTTRIRIIRKLANISRKIEVIRTIAAPCLMCNSGVASEKMKIAMIKAE